MGRESNVRRLLLALVILWVSAPIRADDADDLIKRGSFREIKFTKDERRVLAHLVELHQSYGHLIILLGLGEIEGAPKSDDDLPAELGKFIAEQLIDHPVSTDPDLWVKAYEGANKLVAYECYQAIHLFIWPGLAVDEGSGKGTEKIRCSKTNQRFFEDLCDHYAGIVWKKTGKRSAVK